MSMLTDLMVDLISGMPESFIWRFARRYIAGPRLEDGMRVMKDLHDSGILNSMDILGEDTETEEDAQRAYQEYVELIAGMSKTLLPGNISLKLTQLGLKVDPEKTLSRVRDISERAGQAGFFFRIDMEDSTTTDATIDIFRKLRETNKKTGMVIQAYLKRSVDDVRSILEEEPANIRICKGIYREDAAIAYHDRQTIRDNFMDILRLILDMKSYPAIATHDPYLIRGALDEIRRRKLAPEEYEFQMLHGVGFKWRKMLLDAGHRLRVYIPYGAAWRAYSLRRFRENPTLAFYVVKNLVVKT